ncbi:lipopolysaccharide biosynthesis protein [Rudanella paleaurantiibacter]|uniref:Lipopolysaccharide biosynthesis protein n=1 Tax=Rudanella paleaurantiibacter TaxID=2614655 RepID=A0A7J5TZN2_9BACT|nr:lipopolysaccharide biosynthesis protein [Rudanella paleaurantiibacter]KAB7729356.1 lipopolysaccharide biosynthesis protein [Rudanella paleaurantiibacter]
MTEETKSALVEDSEIEIRLSDVVHFLKQSRRAILVGGFTGALIFGVYAFLKPNEYSASCTIIPEIQSKGAGSLGNLGSLAGLAGIDVGGLSSSTDAIRPDLYPNILQSVPFFLHMLEQKVVSDEFKVSEKFEVYLAKKRKQGFAGWLNSFWQEKSDITSRPWVRKMDGVLYVSKTREGYIKEIGSRVSATYDKKTSTISISATMQDPVVAASVANHVLSYLTNYITLYRTEKSRREVSFLNKQVEIAKERYQKAELALSLYRDQNRGLFLNTAKVEEQRIQAEFLLAQDLYNTLSKQTEMAKVKVQENTPVFNVIEPVKIPLRKSAPSRAALIITGLAIGILISVGIRLVRSFL